MLSELGRRPMLGKNENSFGDEFEKDIMLLLQRRQEADDHEKELNLYRSGSAPPTVEGSISAVGGLFKASPFGEFDNEEELRSDPAYLTYYYSNVNMNPRLPPPLLSREDWRFTQRLQGGSSAVGRSLHPMPPGFNLKKGENESENYKMQEWGVDGLIGLPGLGVGSKQKSLAENFQDDLTRATVPGHPPSRPSSRNTTDDNATAMGSVEAELAHLRRELTSSDPIHPPASYSYAAVLGTSLSRGSTPDPQRNARAPSPCPSPIGGVRTGNSEKRNINSPSSFKHANESTDLVSALSGMNLSNGITNEGNDNTNGVPSYKSYAKESPNAHGISQYQHFDSPNMSYLNYGLGGYPTSPISGQLGSPNLPPLFENAAAASAMIPGMDFRMLGGSNIGTAGYQSLSRIGNRASAQFAAHNDLPIDRNYTGNAYIDLLQKAYVENLLSQSQYGVPLGVKTGVSSPHGYFTNPAFGYAGSPLSPVMPGGGAGSPMRHGDFNSRFSGGVSGFAPSLLEEFKSNKSRSFELSEIAGHVMGFSADQYGSRFIQQKLETATVEEKNIVFQEIFPQALELMTDVFGNYVIQKFFEHGMAAQRRELGSLLLGNVLTLSLQMYGCRVIQKAIEVVDVDQKIKMVGELDGNVMRCVRDQNGNHVIQKCIECVPEEHIHFIVSTFYDQVVALSTHPYGCRVMQRVLEHCRDEKTQSKVMEEILASVSKLAQDQYGNYVIQHVLEHGKPHERTTIIRELAGKIVQMSQQKFASNVVEKCLTFSDPSQRLLLVNEILGTTDENEPLQAMMKDQFANYVVQKVLETCSDQQRELIMSRIKVHLNALKKYTYGKHIVARVEKLVAAGERRIALQTLNPA